LRKTSTTQLAPFLQRFWSDSEQEAGVVVSLRTVDSVGDVAAVVEVLSPVITRSQAVARLADRTAPQQTI